MPEFREESIFPFPSDQLWKLLRAHWEDDTTICRIHPLVRSQKTLSRSANEVVVERTIEARGQLLTSQWKFTFRPPEFLRYEIVAGEGPYAVGSFVEVHYSDAPNGTLQKTHFKGWITVLPFFLPQRVFVKRILTDIDKEDEAFLRR